MRRLHVVAVAAVTGVTLLGMGLWAHAGDLNPPAGPVAPTMKTLDQIYAAIAAIPGGGGGAAINRVVRGVITFPDGGPYEVADNFSPSIDPSKSVAVLSDAVIVHMPATYKETPAARNGACLMGLTASSITVRIDETIPNAVRRVSYQIIEYK